MAFYQGTKFLGDQISQGPNFLGLKFLGAQISWGPKKSGAQMISGTISVIAFDFSIGRSVGLLHTAKLGESNTVFRLQVL